MGNYVTLTMTTGMYREIIDDLIEYCSNLNNYWSMEDAVHLIDALEEEYNEDMSKQNKEFIKHQKYEKLFAERNDEFNVNKYENFQKINKIFEKYMEDDIISIFDEKQQFYLIMDIINTI